MSVFQGFGVNSNFAETGGGASGTSSRSSATIQKRR